MLELKSLVAIGILFWVALGVFINKLLNWKRVLDKQNLRLVQLYLELKFLYKNLTDSAEISCSTAFCRTLIASIKEYYNLEEIVIIDSVRMNFPTDNGNTIRAMIHDFMQNNENKVRHRAKNKSFTTQYAEFGTQKYIFYIFELVPHVNCDSFIICVENYPTLLTKNELLGLENNINLLKNRMIYD